MPQTHNVSLPSFYPLYESDRSNHFPEVPDWLDARHLPETALAQGREWTEWTDVLVDFRVPPARTWLPAMDEVCSWPSDAPGWSLRAWTGMGPAHNGGENAPLDAVTVTQFTDPDGFRFSIVVSQDNPGARQRMSTGRVGYLLPSMKHVFMATGRYVNINHVFSGAPLTLNPSPHKVPTYSLETLRDAVRDPAAWFGVSADKTAAMLAGAVEGPYRTITNARTLLAWASGGVTSWDEARPWAEAGLDAAEVAAWRHAITPVPPAEPVGHVVVAAPDTSIAATASWSQPPAGAATVTEPVDEDEALLEGPWPDEEIRDWFGAVGGGSKRRQRAIAHRKHGMTPQQGGTWGSRVYNYTPQVSTTRALVKMLPTIEGNGWTPEDMDQITTVHGFPRMPLDEFTAWAQAFEPRRAYAYAKAGMNPVEATGLDASENPPDLETLEMMAALT